MAKWLAVAALALLVGACGARESDRALSGAGIGAVAGAPLGPVGALAGAGAGAATGAVTEEEDIRLGEPLWRR